jgi:hypothetical protein
VEALLAGKLVIPSIQRGYVWRRKQVPDLLESLYRGYPVGALLVWKTSMQVPLRPSVVLENTPLYDHPAVLLDGQQRLTSLAKVRSGAFASTSDSICAPRSFSIRARCSARISYWFRSRTS